MRFLPHSFRKNRPVKYVKGLLLLFIFSCLTTFSEKPMVMAAPQQVVPAVTVATTPLPQFTANTRIVIYTSDSGDWTLATCSWAKPGNEFYFNGRLYRVTGSSSIQFVLKTDSSKLFEADRSFDKSSRQPSSTDVVGVKQKDTLVGSHELFSSVPPASTIRFQGKCYTIKPDRSLVDLGIDNSVVIGARQHIEVTKSSWQHVMDRHTVGGSKNAGASIWYSGEDIKALIRIAELITPSVESNGYLARDCDAGRPIGYDGYKKVQTSTYRVIATQSGKLVTAYPIK